MYGFCKKSMTVPGRSLYSSPPCTYHSPANLWVACWHLSVACALTEPKGKESCAASEPAAVAKKGKENCFFWACCKWSGEWEGNCFNKKTSKLQLLYRCKTSGEWERNSFWQRESIEKQNMKICKLEKNRHNELLVHLVPGSVRVSLDLTQLQQQ
jgi:hypothetical protein